MKPQLPSTQSLRVFETAARSLNCAQAGKELCLTASAVSKQLQSLEDHLGVELFIRSKHGLKLTEAGHIYWDCIKPVMAKLEEAGARVARHQLHLQDLDVRVLVAFAERWLLPRYSEFADANPDLKIHFDTSTLRDEAIPFAYDAYIRLGNGYWPGCVADYICGRQQVMIASPDLLRRHPPIQSPADLARFPLIGHTWFPNDWAEAFEALGVKIDQTLNVTRWELFSMTIRSACVGHGLALAPLCFVTEELARGELVRMLDYSRYGPQGYYFVFSEDRQDDAALSRFRRWLRSRQFDGEEIP
jgi:DNA-binding transcriptional LysR family regulator